MVHNLQFLPVTSGKAYSAPQTPCTAYSTILVIFVDSPRKKTIVAAYEYTSLKSVVPPVQKYVKVHALFEENKVR